MKNYVGKLKLFAAIVLMFALGACLYSDSTDDEPEKEWTIMYYGAGDNDLEEQLMADISEMETVDVSKKANIVVLMDRYYNEDEEGAEDWSDTRAYEIHFEGRYYNEKLGADSKRIGIHDLGISTSTTNELNMGSSETLEKFIGFCKNNYPARKYALVISDHGDGWYYQDNDPAERYRARNTFSGNRKSKQNSLLPDHNCDSFPDRISPTDKLTNRAICWDETDDNDALNIGDIRIAIEKGFGKKIDLVVFDACLMGSVEVAYELKDVADYMLASQEVTPWLGLPYSQILTKISETAAEISSKEFGKICVNEFVQAYQNGTNVEDPGSPDDGMLTMSLVDLSRIGTLVKLMNKWADANRDKCIAFDERFFVETSYYDANMFDLEGLMRRCDGAEKVADAISDAVVLSRCGSAFTSMCGLSVYFPKHSLWVRPSFDKKNLRFADAGDKWVRYLRNYTPVETKDKLELVSARLGTEDTVLRRKMAQSAFMRMNSANSEMDNRSILMRKDRCRRGIDILQHLFPDPAAFESGIIIGNDDLLSSVVLADPLFNAETPTLIKKNSSVCSYIMGVMDYDCFILDAKAGDGDLRLSVTVPENKSYYVSFFLYNTYSDYVNEEVVDDLVVSGRTYTVVCPDDVTSEPEIDPDTGEEIEVSYYLCITSADGTFSQDEAYTFTLETVK